MKIFVAGATGALGRRPGSTSQGPVRAAAKGVEPR